MARRVKSNRKVYERYYTEQRNWTIKVLSDCRLTESARIIGAYWAQKHMNKKDACAYVGLETLARELSFCAKTAKRAITSLQKFGYLKFVRPYGRSNEYRAIGITPISNTGPESPRSGQDNGHCRVRNRTVAASNAGLWSPPNQREPKEPPRMPSSISQLTSLIEDRSPVAAYLIKEKWEKILRCRSAATASAMMRTREDSLKIVSLALDDGLIDLDEAEQLLEQDVSRIRRLMSLRDSKSRT